MKFHLLRGCVFVALCLSVAGVAQSKKVKDTKTDQTKAVDIAKVLAVVEQAVNEAEQNHVEKFPPLKSVELSLNTAVAKDVDGKLKFFIFSVGGGKSWEKSSTITLQLSKPTQSKVATQSAEETNWKTELAKAIALGQENFKSARDKFPGLSNRTVDIEIAFTIKWNAGGGVDTAQLIPV